MITMRASALGLAAKAIQSFEACRLTSYPDKSGVWTIGWGETGPDIVEGLVWSQDLADETFELRVGDFARAVRSAVEVPLTDNQSAALISFTYNVGVEALKESTLLKLLNGGDYGSVPSQMTRWVHDHNGQIDHGLVNRRKAEAGMWNTT